MTQEEYEKINAGDVVRSTRTGSCYTVIKDSVPIDPIVQIRKAGISRIGIDAYEIAMKAARGTHESKNEKEASLSKGDAGSSAP